MINVAYLMHARVFNKERQFDLIASKYGAESINQLIKYTSAS